MERQRRFPGWKVLVILTALLGAVVSYAGPVSPGYVALVKPSTSYVVKFTADTNSGTYVELKSDWYELEE